MCAISRTFAMLIALVMLLNSMPKANAQIVTSFENLQVTQDFATSSIYGKSTVWLGAYNTNPNLGGAASGVVVRNDASGVVVLTAAHFTTLSQETGFTGFKVTTRPNIYVNTAPLISAMSFGTHPGYGGSFGVGVDMGYVTLAAGSMPGVTAAPLSTSPLTAGEHVYLGGYGLPAVVGQPPDQYTYDGIKRIGENKVNFVTGVGYAQTSMIGINLPMLTNLTPGSSGGGMYRDDGSLVGLASWSTTDFMGSYSLTTYSYNSYIVSITPTPEPSSILLVSAIVCIVGLQWRRWHRTKTVR